MIVRESPDAWLLISQVEHAAAAAQMAAVWRLPESLTWHAADFGSAVAHHDDGWREWELAPTIDADGRPRDFMDMPMPVATHLWSHSIKTTARRSPWCGLWVSRHFCHLAELAIEHRHDPDDQLAARRFVAEQTRMQQRWRASAGPDAAGDGDSPIEVAGLHALQFFDRLSLWLCCAERTRPLEIADASGEMTRWEPGDNHTVVVSAAHFTTGQLTLTVPIIAVPKKTFGSDADLHAAIAEGERGSLTWSLIRATPANPSPLNHRARL